MSILTAAQIGYGFKTNVLRANLRKPKRDVLRVSFWNALSEKERKNSYGGDPRNFFREVLDLDTLNEILDVLFPSLQCVKTDGYYTSHNAYYIVAKSTFKTTNSMTEVSFDPVTPSSEVQSELEEALALFQEAEGNEPRWRMWLYGS